MNPTEKTHGKLDPLDAIMTDAQKLTYYRTVAQKMNADSREYQRKQDQLARWLFVTASVALGLLGWLIGTVVR